MLHSKYLLRHNDQQISLDLTPLIDVVFLLLIFFMLSTSFEKTQWLDLQLPSLIHDHAKEPTQQDPFIIGIDPDGNLYFNEKNVGQVSHAELEEQLTQYLPKDPLVVIHGDAKAPHASLVQLLEILAKLQVAQLQIAAMPTE
ncbi:MAG TPA: biopolymer transporter ExbD [Gammaproteobacteria bacterium]|nr:biopolymer transporter ExbD [Gammaproteobacteria bacterium]